MFSGVSCFKSAIMHYYWVLEVAILLFRCSVVRTILAPSCGLESPVQPLRAGLA